MREITPDLGYKRLAIVNVVYYGRPATDAASPAEWVLIDAGLFGTAGRIARSADERCRHDDEADPDAIGCSLRSAVCLQFGGSRRDLVLDGRPDLGVMASGQVVGLIDELPTVAELISRIVKEADEVLERLGA